MPTVLRRWVLRGRPGTHQTGRCGIWAGKGLVERGYTHGEAIGYAAAEGPFVVNARAPAGRGRVADELCARSSQDTCKPPGKRDLSLWARKEV